MISRATVEDNPRDFEVESGPDIAELSKVYAEAVTDTSDFRAQVNTNWETRLAVWPGQSRDGRKHARDGKSPQPWDGASDLRVYLVDDVIREKVALLCTAFKKASVTAVPTEGNDIGRARVVGNFMKWLMATQMPEVDREVELLANYLLTEGVAATGQFWERRVQKTLIQLSLEDLLNQFPDAAPYLETPEFVDAFVEFIKGTYPGTSSKKARRMYRELLETGQTDIAVPGQVIDRPAFRAFSLADDLLLPAGATDIENAQYIFRRLRLTPVQAREKVLTEGWDGKYVEAAIKHLRGHEDFMETDELRNADRQRTDRVEERRDLVPFAVAYCQKSDEDGVPGIYCTVFCPHMRPEHGAPDYAKHELLGYRHGGMPFVIHRLEYLSRQVHDSRGLPEPGKPAQDQIKALRDARIDASSLSVIPPIMYPQGRPPSEWGPAARIPYRRQGEYHYAERPTYDITSRVVEDMLVANSREYFGQVVDEKNRASALLKDQHMVAKFMTGIAHAMQQVWSLWQQYGPDETYFRVIGEIRSQPQLFDKGQPDEKFDFYISFDVLSQDPEFMVQKIKLMSEIAQATDRYGMVDWSKMIQVMFEAIDPTIAERVLTPVDEAQQREVTEEEDAIAKMAAGLDKDIDLNGAAQVRMSVLQNYAESPGGQQKLTMDPVFKELFEKRLKQWMHQIQQQQNAQIGIYGA